MAYMSFACPTHWQSPPIHAGRPRTPAHLGFPLPLACRRGRAVTLSGLPAPTTWPDESRSTGGRVLWTFSPAMPGESKWSCG